MSPHHLPEPTSLPAASPLAPRYAKVTASDVGDVSARSNGDRDVSDVSVRSNGDHDINDVSARSNGDHDINDVSVRSIGDHDVRDGGDGD